MCGATCAASVSASTGVIILNLFFMFGISLSLGIKIKFVRWFKAGPDRARLCAAHLLMSVGRPYGLPCPDRRVRVTGTGPAAGGGPGGCRAKGSVCEMVWPG